MSKNIDTYSSSSPLPSRAIVLGEPSEHQVNLVRRRVRVVLTRGRAESKVAVVQNVGEAPAELSHITVRHVFRFGTIKSEHHCFAGFMSIHISAQI